MTCSSASEGSARPKFPLVVVLLGPPGCGKGTQAQLLKDHYKIAHISTGDLLREHIRKGSPLGKRAQEYMDLGKLVPDSLVFEILFERIGQEDCSSGYILDGFPRTVTQAETLKQRLPKEIIPLIINLKLDDSEIIERLTQRVTCGKCGAPYHLIFAPPQKPGICDRCGGMLIHRSDDTEAVISQRLKVYHEQTEPVVAFYKGLKLLHEVACNLPKEKVFLAIRGLVET